MPINKGDTPKGEHDDIGASQVAIIKLYRMIKRHEGFRAKPYKCTSDKLTIGYGQNLEAGITQEQAEAMLSLQLDYVEGFLRGLEPWFDELDPARRSALIDMCFQLGATGYAKFIKMRSAIGRCMVVGTMEQDWHEVGQQMRASAWYKQTPARCEELAEMMINGEWQE